MYNSLQLANIWIWKQKHFFFCFKMNELFALTVSFPFFLSFFIVATYIHLQFNFSLILSILEWLDFIFKFIAVVVLESTWNNTITSSANMNWDEKKKFNMIDLLKVHIINRFVFTFRTRSRSPRSRSPRERRSRSASGSRSRCKYKKICFHLKIHVRLRMKMTLECCFFLFFSYSKKCAQWKPTWSSLSIS